MATYIVYPQIAWVTSEQIRSWYQDALANNELAEEYKSAQTEEDMARALDDAGIITRAKPRRGPR